MTNPLNQLLGWNKADVVVAFSTAIFFLGLSAAFLGWFVEKYGPRKSGMMCAAFYGIGIMGSGVAVTIGSLPMFILTYGVCGGIGLGVGYITPVSTLVKWFPDRRGLATGMAIMGFGFASLIFGPIMARLFGVVGVANTFYILGAVYFTLIFSSALYLDPPEKGWLPKGFSVDGKCGGKVIKNNDLIQMTANQALTTKRFYYMWVMLFINITCGIAVISVASPMAQEVVGMTPIQAATMVGLMGLFNGIGRISWASLSDVIGRPVTYTTFFVIQIIAFYLLTNSTSVVMFQGLIFLILTCYGGGFSSVPAFLGDLFGTRELGAVHGYTLTAWAAAGVVGPTIVARVREATDSYSGTLYIFAGFFLIAFIVSLLMMMNIKKKRQEYSKSDAQVEGAAA
ncbi:MAG: OFA family MFS transporter [Gammaproteobacteria bacterium]|nr:OFA family MFS transporter [Gammaproteobacteria bacterium]